jgi:tetratricopeptide (TPR) repeat protein
LADLSGMEADVNRRQWGAGGALVGLIVFAAVFAGMSRICTHDFVDWDDAHTLYRNPRLNPVSEETLRFYWTHGEYGLYMPGTYTIWAGLAKLARTSEMDTRGVQLNPRVFHTVSVLLHAGAAVVMFLLLRRLLKGRAVGALETSPLTPPLPSRGEECGSWKMNIAAGMGALVFGLHPVQVESVGWASGMKDVLYGAFALVAVWQYLCAVQTESRRATMIHFVIATLAFVWALLCKPTAMVVPALVFVLDWLVLGRNWKIVLKWTAWWWPISLAWMVVARIAQPVVGQAGPSIAIRPLIALDAVAFYLGKVFWPWKLCIDYGRTPGVVQDHGWLWWTWIVPVIAAALIAWKRNKPLAAAGLLLVICVAPVLGLTPFLFQFYSTVSDHYLYLAMIGPAVAMAWVMVKWEQRAVRTIGFAVIGLLAVKSFSQSATWRDDESMFSHTIAINPNSFLAYNNLASAFSYGGDVMQSAATIANQVGDRRTAESYRKQATENYQRAGELFAEAIETRKSANRGVDDYLKAHGNLGGIYSRLGRHDEALWHRQKAIEIIVRFFPPAARRDLPELYCLSGQDLLALHRPKEAMRCFDEALKMEPANPIAKSAREKARGMMAGMSIE